jgi:hypothetical protein
MKNHDQLFGKLVQVTKVSLGRAFASVRLEDSKILPVKYSLELHRLAVGDWVEITGYRLGYYEVEPAPPLMVSEYLKQQYPARGGFWLGHPQEMD